MPTILDDGPPNTATLFTARLSPTVDCMETNPFRAQRARAARKPEVSTAGRFTTWVSELVAGQVWYYRLPLLLVLAWFLKNYLTRWQYTSLFHGMNLGFHEAGHAAFMWTGHQTWTIAGGTIFELTIPLIAGLYLLVKQRDPFGTSFCLFWFGTALVSSGIYAADALDQVLPLVSPFGPVDAGSHDWTSMLMRFGTLSRAAEIGGAMQMAGKVVMACSILLGSWILWVMAQASSSGGGVAFWNPGEDSRLQAFARGEEVSRRGDEWTRMRMTEEERLREFLDD